MRKTIDEVVNDVINGWYGNGQERKIKLEQLGYNYNEIQTAVNEKMKLRYEYLKFRITIGCVVHEEYQLCKFSKIAISKKINELYKFYGDTVYIEFVFSG